MNTTAAANLLTLSLIAAGILAGAHLPHGPFTHGPGLAGQIIAMDGVFYRSIAVTGYHWNPAIGGTFGFGQNMAFFPAFPLILAILAHFVTLTRVLISITGLALGLLANAAFARLALTLLPSPQARIATLCFAAWPALAFLIMGYPAGLINLCVFNCLYHHIKGRRTRAALWCGLGTAAAPQTVFIAAAFCIDLARLWLASRPTRHTALNNLALCALSVWGLLAFMLFQQLAFHDPLAFLAAQRGFCQMPAFLPHLRRLVSPSWLLLPFGYTHLAITQLLHHRDTPAHLRQNFVLAAQLLLGFVSIILTAAGIIRALRLGLPPIIATASTLLLAGYVWFVATGTFLWLCGPRMLYPATVLFVLLGATPRPKTTIAILAALAVAATAAITAGYGII